MLAKQGLIIHGAMGGGQKNFMLVWRCHQLLSTMVKVIISNCRSYKIKAKHRRYYTVLFIINIGTIFQNTLSVRMNYWICCREIKSIYNSEKRESEMGGIYPKITYTIQPNSDTLVKTRIQYLATSNLGLQIKNGRPEVR